MNRHSLFRGILVSALSVYSLLAGSLVQPVQIPLIHADGDGLLAYYAFDEGQGGIVHDRSGNGMDGVIHGASWITNSSGTSLSFDGDGDYVQADGYFPFAGSDEMTVEAWFKLTGHEGFDGIISSYTGVVYRLMVSPDLNPYYNAGTGSDVVVSNFAFETGQWYHYALTIGGGMARLYVNGTPISESSLGVPSTLPNVGDAFVLGVGEMNSPYKHWLQGVMDEVLIYNRELSEDEIWADMLATSPTPTVQLASGSLEVSESSASVQVPVVLNVAVPLTVTVAYATGDGTALAGSDYLTAAGTLVFEPWTSVQIIEIPILNDAVAEPEEVFTLTLDGPEGAALGTPSSAAVTITDDEFQVSGSLTINGGALASTALNVVLGVAGTGPGSGVTRMSFSNNGSTWNAWQPLAATFNWQLAPGDGVKVVYVRFRDIAGRISAPLSDTIRLDTAAGAEPSVSINDGALFTNQPTVTLTLAAKPGTARMQISNDGGFAGSVWESFDTRRAWTITQYGSHVIPRIVYVRYQDAAGNVSAASQDDIILDVTPPTGAVNVVPPGLAATAGGLALAAAPAVAPSSSLTRHLYLPLVARRYCTVNGVCAVLLLSATDDVSGVGHMQVSSDSEFGQATWQAYRSQLPWFFPAGEGDTVYVRYRDNAGNVSQTYSASPGR